MYYDGKVCTKPQEPDIGGEGHLKNIHFVHTSDWHLGFFQHNKPERYGDYYDAARKVVKEIRKIKPQFVLHTGDLFHHARPTPGAIRQAVRIFTSLKRAKIPVYMIRGNHDGRIGAGLDRGGGVIQLLEDLDILHFIDDNAVFLKEYGIDILGVGYYPGRGVVRKLNELIQEHDFEQSQAYKIVALHAFVEGQLEDINHLPLSRLSELGVNYIGVGHYHIPWKHEKSNIFAPGSTEATSSNDWNRANEEQGLTLYSSFFEVKSDGDTNTVIQHDVPVRPKIKIITEIKETSVPQTIEILSQIIRSKIEKIPEIEPRLSNLKPMIDVELTSDLKFDEMSQVSALLEEQFNEALHFNLTGESDFSIDETFNTADYSHDIEDILLHEAGLEKENGTEFLKITTKLIDELGKIPQSRDMASDTYDALFEIFSSEEMTEISEFLVPDNTGGKS